MFHGKRAFALALSMDYNDLMTNVIQHNMHGAQVTARGSGAG